MFGRDGMLEGKEEWDGGQLRSSIYMRPSVVGRVIHAIVGDRADVSPDPRGVPDGG
jgi:hypothetical protein